MCFFKDSTPKETIPKYGIACRNKGTVTGVLLSTHNAYVSFWYLSSSEFQMYLTFFTTKYRNKLSSFWINPKNRGWRSLNKAIVFLWLRLGSKCFTYWVFNINCNIKSTHKRIPVHPCHALLKIALEIVSTMIFFHAHPCTSSDPMTHTAPVLSIINICYNVSIYEILSNNIVFIITIIIKEKFTRHLYRRTGWLKWKCKLWLFIIHVPILICI